MDWKPLIDKIVEGYVLSWYCHISDYDAFPKIVTDRLSKAFDHIQSRIQAKDKVILEDTLHLIKKHIRQSKASAIEQGELAHPSHPGMAEPSLYLREAALRMVMGTLEEEDKYSQIICCICVDIVTLVLQCAFDSLSHPEEWLTTTTSGHPSVKWQWRWPTSSFTISEQLYDICRDSIDDNLLPWPMATMWQASDTLIRPLFFQCFGQTLDATLLHHLHTSLDSISQMTMASIISFLDPAYSPSPTSHAQWEEDMTIGLVNTLPHWLFGGPSFLRQQVKSLLSLVAHPPSNQAFLLRVLDLIVYHVFPKQHYKAPSFVLPQQPSIRQVHKRFLSDRH